MKKENIDNRDWAELLERIENGAVIPVIVPELYWFQLESQLLGDGIKVWIDKSEIRQGDIIDTTIKDAISKCPVFIPLFSKKSGTLFLDNDNKKPKDLRDEGTKKMETEYEIN